ncbi:unnamed protein product [Acanthoscelides obtectus]|uniref:Uncharacterized protein n=1 Tax=Acanthoscelides obtectus TaxID=200917 RepID=A0A9P0PJY0_ACAOB|nr:unnamed protein product [Acanthoscelides obtectus]CAK1630911.1 hypothetical protein AOBTE_LOCUS6635 [Acanthoscelides obtectus]
MKLFCTYLCDFEVLKFNSVTATKNLI